MTSTSDDLTIARRTPKRLAEMISTRTNLKQIGQDRWRGLCPFHKERSPSFFVFPDKKDGHGRYRCYGCDAWGDDIDWLRKVEGKRLPAHYAWQIDPAIRQERQREKRRKQMLREFRDRNPECIIPDYMIADEPLNAG